MNKKTWLIVVVALVFLLGNTLNASPKAQRSKMMKHSGFGLKMVEKNLFPAKMLLKFKEDIGLSESQIKKIEKMELDFQKYVIKNSADAKLIGLKIKAEFNSDKVNRGKVTDLIKKVAAVKTEIVVNRINYLLDIKSVLKKEQIEKINSLKRERRSRWMKKRKMMKHSGNRNFRKGGM